MPATAYVGTEIDIAIIDAANQALHDTGFSLAEAIRIMVAKTARDKRLPFDAEAALKEEYEDEIPNEETLKAFQDIDRRENLIYAKDAEDMFKKLGI